VLLLDEPFAHLDLPLRERLRVLVASLARETGVTLVMVTHDQDEALEVATRLYILHSGRVTAEGPPASLYSSPPTLEAASFLGHNIVCGPPFAGPREAATFPPDGVDIEPGGEWVVSRAARRRGYWLVEAEPAGGPRVRVYLRGPRAPPVGSRVSLRVEWGLRRWGPGSCARLPGLVESYSEGLG